MRCTVAFAFDIGDPVSIIATEHPGIVTGMLQEKAGPQYRVVWWNNGERKNEWLFEFELKPPP